MAAETEMLFVHLGQSHRELRTSGQRPGICVVDGELAWERDQRICEDLSCLADQWQHCVPKGAYSGPMGESLRITHCLQSFGRIPQAIQEVEGELLTSKALKR